MGVFRPGLYLVFKEGAATPPVRNLKIKQTNKQQSQLYSTQ